MHRPYYEQSTNSALGQRPCGLERVRGSAQSNPLTLSTHLTPYDMPAPRNCSSMHCSLCSEKWHTLLNSDDNVLWCR